MIRLAVVDLVVMVVRVEGSPAPPPDKLFDTCCCCDEWV